MAFRGDTKSDPICIDSSPGPSFAAAVSPATSVSPVKVASPKALPKCRKLLLELGVVKRKLFDQTSGESELSDSPQIKRRCKQVISSSSESDWTSSDDSDDEEAMLPPVMKKSVNKQSAKDDGVLQYTRSGAPIFEMPPDTYTGEQILAMLLDPKPDSKRICHVKPTNVDRSSTFVVDLDSLKHPDDVKKDEFGKWLYSGSHVQTYLAWKKKGQKLRFEKVDKADPRENVFQLRRIRCKHPSNLHFQRLLAFVTDAEQNPHHLCLLSYRMPTDFTPIIASHGNSQSEKPFFPTLPSTKKEIELHCKTLGPKNVMGIVSDKLGGVVDASGPCELPRNERQISYIKSKSTCKSGDPLSDQVFAIMQSAKEEDFMGKFVRETRPSPEPAFVLARDRQLDDLVRFCTVAEGFSILTVDPTFNLGDFDVTPTTYRHCLLTSVRSGKSPVFIGPTMVHYRKTFRTYVFFASTLVGLRPELQGLRAFGTDGEKCLVDAFSHEFRYAIHLTCFIHVRQNIKRKLQELQYPQTLVTEVLNDVFGCKQGDTFAEGLVDSSSEEEFDTKLQCLKERWSHLEDADCIEGGIFDWFVKHKALIVKQTMIRNVREEAGLGVPPEPFTTNASETINSVIKVHVSYKPSQLMEFVGKLKELIDEQEKELERAVIGRGKYKIREEYAHLVVNESQWFSMSKEQRQAHLKKVSHTTVSSTLTAKATHLAVSLHSPSAHLSIEVETVAELVAVPLPVLQGVWKKAEETIGFNKHHLSSRTSSRF